jgi:hypothetical protein
MPVIQFTGTCVALQVYIPPAVICEKFENRVIFANVSKVTSATCYDFVHV